MSNDIVGKIIPWTSRARRFAANCAALETRTPSGAALVRDAGATANGGLEHLTLHQLPDGNFQVRDTVTNQWLGGLADHKAATGLWSFDRHATPVPPPIAFDGLGFAWLFLHVLETTANSFLNYSCAAYVLEGDPLALAMLFYMHDLQAVIAHPRTRWFIATNADSVAADFRAALQANPAWTVPERYVTCAMRQRPALPMDALIQDLRNERDVRRSMLIQKIHDHYSLCEADSWHHRFTHTFEKPLRVLGITSRYTTVLQHSMAEWKAAIEAAGCRMEIAMEPDDHSLENPFLERIAQFQPDLIVQLSRLRYENPRMPRELPFLCWDQDNLPGMRTDGARESLDALTFVAGHGAVFGFGHLDWPERSCLFCHPAGATHRYHAGRADPQLLAQHACDISYVSNASAPPESLAAQLRTRWSGHPAWNAVFSAATERIEGGNRAGGGGRGASWDDVALADLLRELAEAHHVSADEKSRHEMAMDLHRFADRCFRHATLAWVSRWCIAQGKSLRLYGAGWESHPAFARWSAGPAAPGEMMRAIYQASRINLQIIASGFIHSRSLDGLAAGGFFLTRHVPADGDDLDALRDIHTLAAWVVKQKIDAPAQLEAAADEAMRRRWQRMRGYHPWPADHAMRVLKVWAKMPYPGIAFPQLPRISFRDEAGFAAVAEHFLSDEPARRALAAEMREIVLHHFSYDSRWKEFLAHITEALRHP